MICRSLFPVSKELIDIKLLNFTGVKENIDYLADRNALIYCNNMESHVRPGVLTLRPPYELRYEYPIDELDRILEGKFISFDNFYENTAADGVECTILVQTGIVQSPAISGTRITDYVYNGIMFWMRPYWNGIFWEDKWQWLNETTITKIVTPSEGGDPTKYVIAGKFNKLTQYVIINKTRDATNPVAILYSEINGDNTNIWISLDANGTWLEDDVLIIMRCYIPQKYQLSMYYVDQREISFHRLPSRIRIGFGGKKQRIGVGIEYVKKMVQVKYDGNFPAIAGKETDWAYSNKMVVQPYTQINEDQLDFTLFIKSDTGSLAAGRYYFRMTAVLDGFNEILVYETSAVTLGTTKLFPIPHIRTGAISRRLTSVKVYVGTTSGTEAPSYYLFKEYLVSEDTQSIIGADWTLLSTNDIYYSQNPNIGNTLYTETSSARSASDNAIGSWLNIPNNAGQTWGTILVTGSAGAYYLSIKFTDTTGIIAYSMQMDLPQSALTNPLKPNTKYTITLTYSGNADNYMRIGFRVYEQTGDGVSGDAVIYPVTSSPQTITFSIYTTGIPEGATTAYLDISYVLLDGSNFVINDQLNITNLSIAEEQTGFIETLPTGTLDTAEMGYTPTLNIVKDWQAAVVINGQTFAGNAYIEQAYKNLIFFSPIAGSGANQYDVLIAGKFLDADKDNYRGETIIGLSVLLTLELIAFTEGGAIVIDPSTGQTREVARGYGIMTKETIQKFRETIYWGSTEDIIKISASTGYQAIQISDDSVRGVYNGIADKTLVVACVDRYGTYHIVFRETENPKEMLFADRGWTYHSREHHPVIMRNGFMNRVWFMDANGNIYSIPQNVQEDIGYADVYGRGESGW